MNVAERKLGMYMVHAAALDVGANRGYQAGVIVTLNQGAGLAPLEVFRDEQLEGAKVWECPRQALAFALDVGEAATNTHEVFGDFDQWRWKGLDRSYGSPSLHR